MDGETHIQLVLNTRNGTRKKQGAFNSCTWHLNDPIFSPLQGHKLYVDIEFCAIPFDHLRLNNDRKTTSLIIETLDTATNVITPHIVEITPGTYDLGEFYNELNVQIRDYAKIKNLSINSFKSDFNSIGRTYHTVVENGDGANRQVRIVAHPDHKLHEVLGFYETSPWIDSKEKSGSVPDIQGTRTITICSVGLAGESPDPVTLERRRKVLKVVPVPPAASVHTPSLHLSSRSRGGHFIDSRVIDKVEIELFDDMGMPFDPQHHWSIGLEIRAGVKKNFVYRM